MNALDSIIGFFSPRWAVDRVIARATLQQIEGFGGSKGGYDAGKLNRYTKGRIGSEVKEHSIPLEQIERLRWQSWQLWRNNPYARKIVRTLESKVVGAGMCPQSQATMGDGSPHIEFRRRARELWQAIQSGFDARGVPGRGGQTFSGLQRLALRSTILSGEVLQRLVPIDTSDQSQRELPVPMVLQLIDAARLADDHNPPSGMLASGTFIYRGIELDGNGKRLAYWLNSYQPGMSSAAYGTAQRIPAEQVCHLYAEDDIDQLRGVPWFASALLQIRDTGDLQYNVLKSSAMAACVVMGYRKPSGAQRFGLNAASETNSTSADGTDLTDSDGNAITKIQPGMFVNLGKDGALEGFSPNQPTTNAEAFIQHMLRGTAAGIPGVKGSTLTGDYRNSSFSSERSADNDTWPEIEALQEWFATSFCQPIYEAVVRAGVLSGWFDGIVTPDEFQAAPSMFTAAKWQGSVARSINPTDDANAAGLRMQFGLSSPQMECAKVNTDWLQIINDVAEFYDVAEEKGLPQEFVNNVMGIGSQDVIAQAMATGGAKPGKQPPEKPEAAPEQTDDAPAEVASESK